MTDEYDDWTDNLPTEYVPDDTYEDLQACVDSWNAESLWDGELTVEHNDYGEYVLILELEDGTYQTFNSVKGFDDAIEDWTYDSAT